MSLPHLLKKQLSRFAFRERINFNFTFPEIDAKIKNTRILVPEKNKNSGEAGTAFDYLLRFYVEFLNKNKSILKTHWVATSALERLNWAINKNKTIASIKYYWAGKKISKKSFYRKVLSEFEDTIHHYKLFIDNGEATINILRSCLFLAKLDVYIRDAFNLVESFGIYKEEELKELENLFNTVPKKYFKAKNSCILNPYFPNFNTDGDLVIDDTLIEIKTTNKIELKADYRYQLIYYYILHLINGVNGNREYSIQNLGIYYSRFGILYTIPIKEVGHKKAFKSFKIWYLSTLRERDKYKKSKLYREDEYQIMIDNKIDTLLKKLNVVISDSHKPFDPVKIHRESSYGYCILERLFENQNDYNKFQNEVYKKL